MHDDDGNVMAFVTSPTGAPPIHVAAEPGQQMSELELPDLKLDLEGGASAEEIAERLRDYRVDPGRKAKLILKRKPKPKRKQ
jgi:hypothetical protein